MSDLIEKKDVVELLNNSYVQEDGIHNWRDHNNDCIDKLIEKVKAMPVLSARPKGEWIYQFRDSENEEYRCSVCGFPQGFKPNFCPNCGSDNREREGE